MRALLSVALLCLLFPLCTPAAKGADTGRGSIMAFAPNGDPINPLGGPGPVVDEPDASPGAGVFHRRLVEAIGRAFGLPSGLMWAVARTESGYIDGEPWPWTLNINGTPKRYESRDAMWHDLHEALNSGIKNVDIGPMQVNWRFNGHRFVSAWTATDPIANVVAAASLLRELYRKYGDWEEAIGRYHSGRPRLKDPYYRRVMARWH